MQNLKDVCATKEMISSSNCPKCKNTGWIYDKSTNTCKKCDCYEKLILANRREFADFPISFLSTTLRNFNQSIYDKKNTFLVSEALKMIKLYLEDFEKQKEEGLGFYIWSNAKGSGKTRLAISIANELLEKHNCRVKFATSVAILNEIKSTWNDTENTEDKLINDLVSVDVLVIDDFGTEQVKGWINEKFYQIVNERYMNRKITIYTSNKNIDELVYDERIIDRIIERNYQLHFAEESIRKQLGIQLNKRLKGGE